MLSVNIVGKRLQYMREKHGWSKTYVAKRLGYSATSTYANWEYGLRNPDTESISKLADMFDCTTDFLLGRSNSRNLTKEDEEFEERHDLRALAGESRSHRFQGIDDLDEEQREELQDFIELLRRQKQRREERRKKE